MRADHVRWHPTKTDRQRSRYHSRPVQSGRAEGKETEAGKFKTADSLLYFPGNIGQIKYSGSIGKAQPGFTKKKN